MSGEAKTLPKSHVCTVTPEQLAAVESFCRERGWEFGPLAYGYWKAAGDKVNVAAYKSGKLTVQGAGTADFVLYFLEPEVLHTTGFGYDAEPETAAPIDPHGGIDESGKGDFFGPLVIAGVCVDAVSGAALAKAGVCDSKLIKSDRRIAELAHLIRNTVPGRFAVVAVGPEAYNRMYHNFGNLNRLLAWGHARTIENLLEKVPDCPRMLSDKFGDESLIQRALQTRGRTIRLDQETKAERDVAVAAASILARDGFVRGLATLAEISGVALPRGAGSGVLELAQTLAARDPELLVKVAKTHFRTYYQAMGLPVPEKTPWNGGRNGS